MDLTSVVGPMTNHHGPNCRPNDPNEKKPLRELQPNRRSAPKKPSPAREPVPAGR